MMKNIHFKLMVSVIWMLMMLCLIAPIVLAQSTDDPYLLDINRDFGLGAGSLIRGTFSMRISGPVENITHVTYQIDGQVMAEMDAANVEAPFRYQFKTTAFADGWHDLTAEVTLKDGSKVITPARHLQFASSEQESGSMQQIFIPMLILILVIGVASSVSVMATARRHGPVPPGTPRKYGVSGGAICPKCGRPTPLHFAAINLVPGYKYDVCENCGKRSNLKRISEAQLRAAEEAERKLAENENVIQVREVSEEEKMRQMLDQSKYTE